jgi:Protein of unknown function (DUF2380)
MRRNESPPVAAGVASSAGIFPEKVRAFLRLRDDVVGATSHLGDPRLRFGTLLEHPMPNPSACLERTIPNACAFAGLVLCGATAIAAADPPSADAATPVKIAVFAFELEDFSAAGQAGSAPLEASYLAQSTAEARRILLQSGRYTLVDTAGADLSTAGTEGLRHCDGCEAAIARTLGADQAFLGVVTKISMTEYTVKFQLRNAGDGTVTSSFATDLRMGADYSWPRGVRWLMQNGLLAQPTD